MGATDMGPRDDGFRCGFEWFNLDLCHWNRQLHGRQEKELTMIYVGGLLDEKEKKKGRNFAIAN
jgi:hypothetical protein